jgi:hypothetical protein
LSPARAAATGTTGGITGNGVNDAALSSTKRVQGFVDMARQASPRAPAPNVNDPLLFPQHALTERRAPSTRLNPPSPRRPAPPPGPPIGYPSIDATRPRLARLVTNMTRMPARDASPTGAGVRGVAGAGEVNDVFYDNVDPLSQRARVPNASHMALDLSRAKREQRVALHSEAPDAVYEGLGRGVLAIKPRIAGVADFNARTGRDGQCVHNPVG